MKKYIVLAVLLVLPTTVLARGNHRYHRSRSNPQPIVNQPISNPQPNVQPTGTERVFTSYITSYASGDNDPAGSTVTYLNGVEGNAGGDGSYTNPITIAVGYVGSKGDYDYGTMFYIPEFQAYFIAQDTCAACHKDNHLDVYAGDGNDSAITSCEYALTGNYTLIQSPIDSYPVTKGPLFSNGICRK